MVEAEGAVAAQQAVIAEQAAGRVADDGVGPAAGALSCRRVEQRVIANQPRARAGDCQPRPRDLAAIGTVQDDLGGALRPPRLRGRVDQMAQRVVLVFAEAQEKAGREAGRAADIGLRLVEEIGRASCRERV